MKKAVLFFVLVFVGSTAFAQFWDMRIQHYYYYNSNGQRIGSVSVIGNRGDWITVRRDSANISVHGEFRFDANPITVSYYAINGDEIQRGTINRGNPRTVYDAANRKLGSYEDKFSLQTYYDASGRKIGTVDLGTGRIYDASDRQIGSVTRPNNEFLPAEAVGVTHFFFQRLF
jgi:hypothetical protein